MKPERAKMPGSIVGHAVLLQHCLENFAVMLIPTSKPKTEAFRASECLNASRIQVLFCNKSLVYFPTCFSLSSTKKPPPRQGAEVQISALPPYSSLLLRLYAYTGRRRCHRNLVAPVTWALRPRLLWNDPLRRFQFTGEAPRRVHHILQPVRTVHRLSEWGKTDTTPLQCL
jgi:hypothetical protein